MGIKDTVKEWAWETWDAYVKEPITKKTEELENEASQKWNEYSDKAKETAWKPIDYYKKQETFHRGLFWIAIALLLILWIISGS